MADNDTFFQEITKDKRHFPVLVGVVVLGVTLLVYSDLSEPLKHRFVPSLMVYVLGLGVIAYFERMADWYRMTQKPPTKPETQRGAHPWYFLVAVICHFAWFVAFIVYNFWYGVLGGSCQAGNATY